ncbi:WD40-repeat-containing domain protein [Chytridium lagenaria]|nr:WD40-repeat-containing domain protein [Chytridium lagenaria]
MKRFQVSKFKNASLQESKKELHYSTHPPLSGLDGAPIKAAVDRFALRKGTRANAVIIVPLNIPTPRQVDPEKSITLQAESTISDVDWGFKTSSGRLIATALSSGTVAFYDVPDAFDAEVSGTPFHRISPYSTNVESVLFHPTASSLIASVSADTITLTEFEAGNKSVSASVSGPIDAFDFRGDGTLITTISRDNSLTVIDPRASSLIVKSTKSHFGNKPMRVAWLGNADLIMSTGFSRTREREYSIWDVRNFSQPSHTEKFDVSSSPLIPLYDADTNLVFFTGREIDRLECWT